MPPTKYVKALRERMSGVGDLDWDTLNERNIPNKLKAMLRKPQVTEFQNSCKSSHRLRFS